MKTPSTTVYHYCPVETFLSIIEGKGSVCGNTNIRLTHTDFLVDTLDNKFLMEYLDPILKEYGLDNKFESSKNDIFIACFSKTADNVHMWNVYADNEKGLAIGFDFSSIINDMKSELRENHTDFLSLNEVIYNQPNDVEKIIEGYKERLLLLKEGKEIRYKNDDKIVRFFPEWFYELIQYNHLTKETSWIKEDEIRLVFNYHKRINELGMNFPVKPKHIYGPAYRVDSEKKIIPYFEFECGKFITEIVIGKQSNVQKNVLLGLIEKHLNTTTIKIKFEEGIKTADK